MIRVRSAALILLVLLISGCTVGPFTIYGGFAYNPLPDATREIPPTPASAICWVNTHAGLNVRSGPDLSYPVTGGPLAYGEEIQPITGAGNWIRIANPPGWVVDWLVWCD